MKMLYLVVEQLKGQVLIKDILEKFTFSLRSLRKYLGDVEVEVYSHEPSPALRVVCRSDGCGLREIPLHRDYPGEKSKLNVLVEKIIILRDYPPEEDCVIFDLDTEFVADFRPMFDGRPVLGCPEYLLSNARNLDRVLPRLAWEHPEIRFDPAWRMYNSGFIHIPRAARLELCQKALHIVDVLNGGAYPQEERVCNGLDEQIALSMVLQERYGADNIPTAHTFFRHFWLETMQQRRWW